MGLQRYVILVEKLYFVLERAFAAIDSSELPARRAFRSIRALARCLIARVRTLMSTCFSLRTYVKMLRGVVYSRVRLRAFVSRLHALRVCAHGAFRTRLCGALCAFFIRRLSCASDPMHFVRSSAILLCLISSI